MARTKQTGKKTTPGLAAANRMIEQARQARLEAEVQEAARTERASTSNVNPHPGDGPQPGPSTVRTLHASLAIITRPSTTGTKVSKTKSSKTTESQSSTSTQQSATTDVSQSTSADDRPVSRTAPRRSPRKNTSKRKASGSVEEQRKALCVRDDPLPISDPHSDKFFEILRSQLAECPVPIGRFHVDGLTLVVHEYFKHIVNLRERYWLFLPVTGVKM